MVKTKIISIFNTNQNNHPKTLQYRYLKEHLIRVFKSLIISIYIYNNANWWIGKLSHIYNLDINRIHSTLKFLIIYTVI